MKIKASINIIIFISVLITGKAYSQFDVKQFGAIGDGKNIETNVIQNAIDKAYENGGGTVEIPAGIYKTGTLILKDNVNLHLQPGAELLGSENANDYKEVLQKFESRTKNLYAKYFVIFAEDAKNISITGFGSINGNGLDNFQIKRPQNERPFLIRLVNCENVTIKDVQLLESANWTLHLLGCRDVNVDGVIIKNTMRANRDGLDIDCCQRVRVSNSRFSTGDDAIVLKATNDVLCEDITITNNIIHTRASAIKTGTESNGGFKNITISNCVIKDIPVHEGIILLAVDGGIMQNIVIENIAMENVATPFCIRLGNRTRPYKRGQYVKKTNDFKDIHLNNISVVNAKLPSIIMGLHNRRIQNVSITNYSVRYSQTQKSIDYNRVPFKEFSYPMAKQYSNLPAYGFYCRNVSGLNLQNINIFSVENEKRPALTFDRVNNLTLFRVEADVKEFTSPMIYLRNIKDMHADFCQSKEPNSTLFEIENKNSRNIQIANSYLKNNQTEIKNVKSLPDIIFDDFDTDNKYSVEKGEMIKGLTSQNLSSEPIEVEFEISSKGTPQICLLLLNEGKGSEKVKLKYGNTIQEFLIDWNEWGWAPISLVKEIRVPSKLKFEIYTQNEKSNLKLAKVYVRYQSLGYTD